MNADSDQPSADASTAALPFGHCCVFSSVEKRAGDVFREHHDQIYSFVRRRTRSGDDAEDIVQAVFASAVAHLEQTRRETKGAALAWLYTAARNRLIDEARRAKRTGPTIPLHEVETAAPERVYGGQLARALAQAIAELPARQQRVVVLRLIEGRSFAEIAATTGATEAACKMRLARALESVRSYLEKEGLDP